MFKSPEELRAEFDQVARRFEQGGADADGRKVKFMPIKGYLTERLPARGELALEIGCGLGTFTPNLAKRFDKVTALDLSPEMARMARSNTREFTNIEFIVADVNAWDFPVGQCDCVVSITTLHHMPIEPVLKKMRDALKPGGTLLVGDFYEERGMKRWARKLRGMIRPLRRKLWGSNARRWSGFAPNFGHDPKESYLTVKEVRRVCASLLPGAKVDVIANTYSIEWKKP